MKNYFVIALFSVLVIGAFSSVGADVVPAGAPAALSEGVTLVVGAAVEGVEASTPLGAGIEEAESGIAGVSVPTGVVETTEAGAGSDAAGVAGAGVVTAGVAVADGSSGTSFVQALKPQTATIRPINNAFFIIYSFKIMFMEV